MASSIYFTTLSNALFSRTQGWGMPGMGLGKGLHRYNSLVSSCLEDAGVDASFRPRLSMCCRHPDVSGDDRQEVKERMRKA